MELQNGYRKREQKHFLKIVNGLFYIQYHLVCLKHGKVQYPAPATSPSNILCASILHNSVYLPGFLASLNKSITPLICYQ